MRELDRLACTPARTGRTNTRMRALAHTRLIAHQSRRPLAPLRSGHGPHVNMPTCDRGLSGNMPVRDRGLRGNAPMRDRGLSGSDTIGLKVCGPQARPHTCTDGKAWVRTEVRAWARSNHCNHSVGEVDVWMPTVHGDACAGETSCALGAGCVSA